MEQKIKQTVALQALPKKFARYWRRFVWLFSLWGQNSMLWKPIARKFV